MTELIICMWCARQNDKTRANRQYCESFPEGITIDASDMLYAGNPHTSPLPGDNGLLFVPRKDVPPKTYEMFTKRQQKNTIQDDIADTFNEENKGGSYQRTVTDMNKAVSRLADDIFAAIDKEEKK